MSGQIKGVRYLFGNSELFHAWSTVWKKRRGKLEEGETRWGHAFGESWNSQTIKRMPNGRIPNGYPQLKSGEIFAFRVENQILAERGEAPRQGLKRPGDVDEHYGEVEYKLPAADLKAVKRYLK